MDKESLEAFEECVGLYATDSTDADTITSMINDFTIRSNLPLNRCRGQCYDGAANMSGHHSGVATQIQEIERAMYIHCMGHCLNLATQDTCRSVNVMADTFNTILELSKTLKYSAKKKAMLSKLKSELAPDCPGIKPLCPTQWTVRTESLRSVLLNYDVILSFLEEVVEDYSSNPEASRVAKGILATMGKFSFLFGVSVSEKVFSITDTLSRAVQKKVSMCQ